MSVYEYLLNFIEFVTIHHNPLHIYIKHGALYFYITNYFFLGGGQVELVKFLGGGICILGGQKGLKTLEGGLEILGGGLQDPLPTMVCICVNSTHISSL